MILFLGAGASKPFGIPTMKEMSEKFENKADACLMMRKSYTKRFVALWVLII